ncbi:MAG: aspartate aminotransferase family protein [Alphaproteobacteria bacterium]|nr:aspartate aminotransferase family protein [Alphaproteobacteria bacterium]
MLNAPMPSVLPVYKRAPVTFERGEAAYLFDRDGRRYLDFGSGIAVTLLGHAHPHLVDVLKAQAERLWHCSNLYGIEAQEQLADRLVEHSFADTAFFCNSGAEALECAIKMARRFQHERGQPERKTIITFDGAFHGRTMATISAGANPKHLDGFEPVLPGFATVPAGDLEALDQVIDQTTAALLIEPIQGEGGIRNIDFGFLEALRRIADEQDLLLIYDEVQCGMGRTGKLFAYEWSEATPDIMALAKGLGGGFPIGACLTTARVAGAMTPGTHGSTFGGNPLACAVANGVLDVLLEGAFLDHVQEAAARLQTEMQRLAEAYPGIVAGVRGRGLMLGLEIADGVTNADIVTRLMDNGLLTVPAADNVVRLLPPLIIGEVEIEEAISSMEALFKELDGDKANNVAELETTP